MGVTIIDPPELGPPHPSYAAITAVPLSSTTTQYNISGQVADDPAGGGFVPDLSSQVDMSLHRLSICLNHIGAKKTDIAVFRYYIMQSASEELDEREGPGSAIKLIGGKVGAWLEGHRPASTYSRIFGMSDDKYLCEFEATVYLSKE